MSLNALGNLSFSNIPVAPPSPGGIQFAAEGLGIQGGDTVVLGGDVLAGSYPVFTGDRVINTNGANFSLFDAEPVNVQMDLNPQFLQINDNVNGAGAFFSTSIWNIFDNFGQITGGISGVNGFVCDVYAGGVSSPQLTLRNSRFNGVSINAIMYDEGLNTPLIDEHVLVDVIGKGMRWGADTFTGENYFGWGFQSPLNPFVQDVFWLTLADTESMSYFEERQSNFKSALTVQNNLPGSTTVMRVIGGTDQLNVQTNDVSGFSIARINLKDATGVSRSFVEWDESSDTARFQGNNIRFNSAFGDAMAVNSSGTVNITNTLMVGDQIQNPTAKVDIIGQDVNPGTAPLKFQQGAALMAVPEDGAFEYDGTDLYFTVGGTRKIVQLI